MQMKNNSMLQQLKSGIKRCMDIIVGISNHLLLSAYVKYLCKLPLSPAQLYAVYVHSGISSVPVLCSINLTPTQKM